MVASGDIVQVKIHQQFVQTGDNVLNVFYFQVSDMAASLPLAALVPDGLGSWFLTDYLDVVRNITSTSVEYLTVEINNLTNYLEDFAAYSPPTPVFGLVGGEYVSQQDAWSFLLRRTTRLTRHGHKRFAGVPENFASNGVVSPTYTANVAAVAERIGSSQSYPDTLDAIMTFNPVILGGSWEPPTIPSIVNPVASAEYRGIGSQNTRKRSFS